MKCVYCGVRKATTSDHVPPRCIFTIPRPSNLITVPSCSRCNKGASKDDEYFKYVISMSDATGDNFQAGIVRDSSMRSLKRPAAAGYRKAILEKTRPVEVRSPQGIFVGTKLGYEVRFDRLFRVLERIVKGLFFHEAGYPLSLDYRPLIHSRDTIADLSLDFQGEMQRNIISPLWNRDSKEIGTDTFQYRFQLFDEDPHLSAWGLTFFGSIEFLASTGPAKLLGTLNEPRL